MSSNTITGPAGSVISDHRIAVVHQNRDNHQNSLHAKVSFAPGDVISSFNAGVVQSYATYLTVQTGKDRHITLQPEFLQYINHSCAPNVFFDTTAMQLICIRAMQAGDEMTFFYPSTEWEMSQPFLCNCGDPGCLQLINGASHLSVETLAKYQLTDFIRSRVKQLLSL